MQSLIDRGGPLKAFYAVLIAVFSFSGISFGDVIVAGGNNMVIKGPAMVKLSDIAAPETIRISEETMVHLPRSVKNVFVERYEFPTSQFTEELRAYTIQQAVFWTVATLALGSSVRQR